MLPELLILLIEDRIAILHLFPVDILEPVKVKDENRWEHFDLQLLEGQSHVIAVRAVPGVFFVELLWLVEQGEAVMDRWLSAAR
jgi:hypothetical protein